MNKGYIHVYYGDGKGKTTAATGLCVRQAGSNGKILFIQFIKDYTSSELNILRKLPQINIIDSNKESKFTFNMSNEQIEDCKNKNIAAFNEALNLLETQKYDMCIFDEILTAICLNVFDEELLLRFLKNKPIETEIVLTGMKSTEKISNIADYISEIKKIKHPFDKGVKARKGIEY